MSVTSYDGGRLGTEEILSGASEVGFENASIEFSNVFSHRSSSTRVDPCTRLEIFFLFGTYRRNHCFLPYTSV